MEIRQRAAGVFFEHPLAWMAGTSGGWLGLVVASPFAPVPLALVCYAVGGVVCHQIADRSFHLGMAQLAVCARCTGIYTGAAVSFLWQALVARGEDSGLYRGPRRDNVCAARVWLLCGALPTVVTVVLEQSGLWPTSNVQRALAGVPLGVALALVAGRAARKLDRRKFQPSESSFLRRAKLIQGGPKGPPLQLCNVEAGLQTRLDRRSHMLGGLRRSLARLHLREWRQRRHV